MIDMEAPNAQDELRRIGAKWIERIHDAEKREKDWIEHAEEAETAYSVDRTADTKGDVPAFNILHSNVETIVPAVFNSPPSPDIRPRHNMADESAKYIASTLERALAAQIDDGVLFTEGEAQTQDACMAGRGIVRVKFDAEVKQIEVPVTDPMTGAPFIDEMGQRVVDVQERVTNERLVWENVSWRDYREGPAKRWSTVPWVAFRHQVDEEEQDRLTDDQIKSLEADINSRAEEDKDGDLTIWEIWCKRSKTVYFVTATGKVLSIQPDPLGLRDFFPMPQPVQPVTLTGKRMPVCPYAVYKEQAGELDKVTKRINKILDGLRVRGFFAGNAGDVLDLADIDDWQLKPVDDLKGFVATGGIGNAIQWMPVDQAILVLRELMVARDQIKATIYEITGISDIVRGASDARETAKAQAIKSQWGSLRIRKLQRLLEGSMRDCLRIGAEIIWGSFSPEAIARSAGVDVDDRLMQAVQQPLDLYRVDVESDSTIRADLTSQREEMAAFLQGVVSYFQAMAPLVQQSPALAQPLIDMFAAFTRQYNLGKQAEDALDQMVELAKQAAQQPQPNPEAEKAKAEIALKQAELKLKELELQIKAAEVGIKVDAQTLDERKAEVDTLLKVNEMQMEQDQKRPVAIGNA